MELVARKVKFEDITSRLRPQDYRFVLESVPPHDPQIRTLVAQKFPHAPEIKPIKVPLKFKLKVPKNQINLSWPKGRLPDKSVWFKCAECGIRGRYELRIVAGGEHPIPRVTYSTKEDLTVFAKMVLGFNVDSGLTKPAHTEHIFASYPLEGIRIPELLTIGAFFDVSAKFGISHINAGVEVESVSQLFFHLSMYLHAWSVQEPSYANLRVF